MRTGTPGGGSAGAGEGSGVALRSAAHKPDPPIVPSLVPTGEEVFQPEPDRVRETGSVFQSTKSASAESFPAGQSGVGLPGFGRHYARLLSAISLPAVAGGRSFGDYELLEEIGRGGMGVVFRARQVSLNRVVAVKLLLFGQFARDENVERFVREAKAAASLQHPNIVPIHEIGSYEGQHYFSMGLIEGRSLAEAVRDKALSPRQSALLLSTVAGAVHHAHQQGIIHRDLKPSNVLLDPEGQPWVTDFGLAKRIDGTSVLTTTGDVLGSPGYLSPEQAEGRRGRVGPRSDVYSLGAILYHLLTGRPPFVGETLEETLLQVVRTEPLAPRGLRANVPKDLETIALRCLAKDPERRYGSAEELREDLDRWLEGEPIRARPAGLLERGWRWSRREPAMAAVVALLTLIAAGSIAAAVQISLARGRAVRLGEELRLASEGLRLASYVADVSLAQRHLAEGDYAEALARLGGHRPKSGQKDLRGFEWRRLWLVCRGNYGLALPRHNQVLGSMEFSPDGGRLATFCWDGTVRLWELESRRLEFQADRAGGLGGFSADGRALYFGGVDGVVRRHDLTGGGSSEVLAGVGDLVAFAGRGGVAATLTRDGRLQVWELEPVRMRFELPGRFRRYLEFGWRDRVALSKDGRFLAVIEPLPGVDGSRHDAGIRVWDVAGGMEVGFLPDQRQLRCLEFSPDGGTLAVGAGDGEVRLWSVAERTSRPIQAHEGPVLSLAFDARGRTLATGGSDEAIREWDVADGGALTNRLRGQAGAVWSLAFAPVGGRLASGSRDSPVRIWDRNARPEMDRIEGLHTLNYANFAFSPDGRRMAAGCRDRKVRVWNVGTLDLEKTLPGMSYVVAFSPDSNHLLASGLEGTRPQWWDLSGRGGEALPTYRGRLEAVLSVDLSPDGTQAALGREDGGIELLEIRTGRTIGVLRGHTNRVHTLRYSLDGNRLLSGGSDHAFTVWDVRRLAKIGSKIEHKAAVCAVAISDDGSRMASGCGAGTIKLWDPADLGHSLVSMSHHRSAIRALDFSRNGTTLASGSEEGWVKLWNPAAKAEVASFPVEAGVRLVKFSPDNNTLAIVTDDGVLRLLRAILLEEADEEAAALRQ